MSGGKRRSFGSILIRTARDGHEYVQARFQPPVWAYSKWPDMPKHYSKNFDRDYSAMAEAWLAEQERRIRLGSWEPPRIEENRRAGSTVTFREYALDFVQRRRKPDGRFDGDVPRIRARLRAKTPETGRQEVGADHARQVSAVSG